MGTEAGIKLDQEKVDPTFVTEYFPRALLAVARVAMFGAQKYTRGGWRSVPDGIRRYTAAMQRHVLAEQIEGPYDEQDSHLLHAAQVAWNALARLEIMLMEGRTVCQSDVGSLEENQIPSDLLVPPLSERVLWETAKRRKSGG